MNSFMRRLINAGNPFMKWMLSSPFHGWVSHWYTLITVTGRKTGKRYCIPVQYAQDGDELYIITSEAYTWWRNLRGGAPVSVHLRGTDRGGTADASVRREDIQQAIRRVYPQVTTTQLDQFANGKVAIHIGLAPTVSAVTV